MVVRYNKDGNYCLSGAADRTIKLWNPIKGTIIKTYSGHGWEVLDLDVSTDNAQISSCGGDKMVFLWDVASGRVTRKFKGHNSKVNCVRFNLDSSVLVTGSYDKTVKIWDCKSRSLDPIQVLDDAKDSVTSVVVTEHEIITAGVDGCVRNYDIRTGGLITDSIGHPLTNVSISQDNACLLLSCLDARVRLLDKAEGEMLNEYQGHRNTQYKVGSCFSNDDAYVMSGSEDKDIYVWDLVEAKLLGKLKGHTGTICSLAYHPTECALLSGAMDNTVRVWNG